MPTSFTPELVAELAAAQPPDGANPIGVNARRIMVNKIKGMTPGRYSQLIGSGPAFRSIFFAGYAPDPAEGLFGGLTGIDDIRVAAMAVGLLCHQMHNVATDLRPQLLINDIRAAISTWNSELRSKTSSWYAYVATITPGDISTALAKFGDEPSRAMALTHYETGLTSASWINAKITQGPAWTNREWELFHHWIKLVALGATPQRVDATIQRAIDGGLPVPPVVGPGAWQTWSGWYGADITGEDFSEATKAILATKCMAVGRSVSCMAEAQSYEFTARSQPGNRYRRAPASSCIAPGAQVVMADASLRAIEDVSAGDVVASRSGTREVLLVSTPPRGHRPLYRIDGTGFAFTSTDAFLIYGQQGSEEPSGPTYAAVDPAALARAVPTFSQFGIRALDRSVLTRHTGAGAQPYEPSGISTVADPPTTLYGIYVDPGEDGRSEYFVGDADTQLLVSSEIPRFMAAPVAAQALIEVLQRSAPTILGVLAPVPDDSFADLLDIGLNAVSRTLVASIGRSLDVTGTGASRHSPVPTEASTLAAVRSFARDFGGARGEAYDWRLGTLLDFFVARFGLQFQGVIHLGWRCFALAEGARGMVLAVSLYGLELFDGGRLPVSDAQFRLELAIDGAVSVRVAAVEGSSSTDYSYYGSDTVSYFPEWRAVVDQAATVGWTLTVVLTSSVDGPEYRSTILLPPVISHGYEYLRGSVHDSAGRAVGQATLDVRCLDADSWAEELRAEQAWTPSREPVVAERLVEAATDYLVATFADAVRAFAGAASTGGGEALLGVSP